MSEKGDWASPEGDFGVTVENDKCVVVLTVEYPIKSLNDALSFARNLTYSLDNKSISLNSGKRELRCLLPPGIREIKL